MSKKEKPKTLGEVANQITTLTKTFQELVKWHDPTGRWRFTYSVSLSAEPIAEVERQVEQKKAERDGES